MENIFSMDISDIEEEMQISTENIRQLENKKVDSDFFLIRDVDEQNSSAEPIEKSNDDVKAIKNREIDRLDTSGVATKISDDKVFVGLTKNLNLLVQPGHLAKFNPKNLNSLSTNLDELANSSKVGNIENNSFPILTGNDRQFKPSTGNDRRGWEERTQNRVSAVRTYSSRELHPDIDDSSGRNFKNPERWKRSRLSYQRRKVLSFSHEIEPDER